MGNLQVSVLIVSLVYMCFHGFSHVAGRRILVNQYQVKGSQRQTADGGTQLRLQFTFSHADGEVGNATEGPGEEDNFTAVELKALKEHNKYRALHGAQPLKLNRELSDMADKSAKRIAREGTLSHTDSDDRIYQNEKVGENLKYECNQSVRTLEQAATNAVYSWYGEIKDPGYDFNSSGDRYGTGHFTQVVWNSTVQLGCGVATGTRGAMVCQYTACFYYPAGNFIPEIDENVFPPLNGTATD